jgi:hypothetical protein
MSTYLFADANIVVAPAPTRDEKVWSEKCSTSRTPESIAGDAAERRVVLAGSTF